jgi:hypothetical protein
MANFNEYVIEETDQDIIENMCLNIRRLFRKQIENKGDRECVLLFLTNFVSKFSVMIEKRGCL